MGGTSQPPCQFRAGAWASWAWAPCSHGAGGIPILRWPTPLLRQPGSWIRGFGRPLHSLTPGPGIWACGGSWTRLCHQPHARTQAVAPVRVCAVDGQPGQGCLHVDGQDQWRHGGGWWGPLWDWKPLPHPCHLGGRLRGVVHCCQQRKQHWVRGQGPTQPDVWGTAIQRNGAVCPQRGPSPWLGQGPRGGVWRGLWSLQRPCRHRANGQWVRGGCPHRPPGPAAAGGEQWHQRLWCHCFWWGGLPPGASRRPGRGGGPG